MEKIEIKHVRIGDWWHNSQGYSEMLRESIEKARLMNFPDKTRNGSLKRIMHGTEFLHGMFIDTLISNDMYQQLKKVCESPDMEYEIIVVK